MALNQKIKTTYGIDCNYWLIDRIEKSKISQTAFIILYGYPSQEIRDKGNNFLERRFFNIYPEDYEKVFGLDKLNKEGINDYSQVYNFIKTHMEEFKEATNI